MSAAATLDAPLQGDAWLMDQVAHGSAAAFRELYGRLQPPLFRLAYATLLDRAEAADVVQEAFIRLHAHARRWRPEARIDAWMIRVTVNEALSLRRRLTRFRRTEPPLEAAAVSPEAQVDARLRVVTVRRVMGNLPPRQRAAAALHLDSGFEPMEIAMALGISPNAARVTLHRALSALREHLEATSP